MEALEEKLEKLEDIIENKDIEISTFQDETNGTKAEMTVVNKVRPTYKRNFHKVLYSFVTYILYC